MTFTVAIEKGVTSIYKNEEQITNIFYILEFIDSARLIAISLSILSIIFLKEFIELNVNSDTMIKNVNL